MHKMRARSSPFLIYHTMTALGGTQLLIPMSPPLVVVNIQRFVHHYDLVGAAKALLSNHPPLNHIGSRIVKQQQQNATQDLGLVIPWLLLARAFGVWAALSIGKVGLVSQLVS